MSQKIYRSSRGTPIDLGAMRLKNENVRAVGNMGVNARGDRLDSNNQVIDSRAQQVQRQYQRQTVATDSPVQSSRTAPAAKPAPVELPVEDIVFPEDVAADDELQDEIAKEAPAAPATGLAAAMAKTKNK